MNELRPLRPATAPSPAAGSLHPAPWTAVRLARPARDLTRSTRFYRDLIGLPPVGGFENHDGTTAYSSHSPGEPNWK
jgi:YycE-like protein